jgi:Nif-specific regulatory protein
VKTMDRMASQESFSFTPTTEQLSALLAASRLLSSSVQIDSLLHLMLVTVKDLMQSKATSLLLVDPGTNELMFKSAVGAESDQLKDVRLKPGQGIAGWVVSKCQSLIVNDVEKDPRFEPRVDTLTGFKTQSILAVPLRDGDRVIGVLEVLNTLKEKRFDQQDLGLLSAFAAHASVALKNAQLVSTITEEKRYLQEALEERYRTLIVESPKTQEVVRVARRVAATPATVLLLGESGVGKEIMARSIHVWSPRASHPFMAVNCVALSDHLLESELFGHEKGAFTGAHQQKKGLFELAHGGTVFLDEIGDMKPELQAKLLRVLQDHEFERVGGSHPIRVDIRVIAATNQDLTAAVKAGRFRKDLFFRLNVVTIALPPLRERREEIPALANFFLERYGREMKRPNMSIAPETMERLKSYDWPGNVRELENIIERAVVLALENLIRPKDVVLGVEGMPDGSSSGENILELPFHTSVDAHKQALIRYAISKAGGSKTRAAKLLQLQPTYLSRLCRQLGIS